VIFLKVLIAILVLLVLLLLLPVGADVGYDERGIRVYVRVWHSRFCLYPAKKKKEKKQTTAKKKNRAMPDISKEEIVDGLTMAVKAVRKLRFRLHKLRLHFTSAFPDPYQTAVVYGYAQAAVYGLGLPQLKQSDISLDMDFAREDYVLDSYVSVTIKVYYIMKLCVCLLMGAIPILLRRRKRIKSTAKGKVA
jgi:hypothetical protein